MLMEGVKVLELGTTIAGPFCGRLLADFGAEVIKVEPLEGDPIRVSGKRFEGKPLYATSIMRNKQLIAIDLRTGAGQDLVRKLVAKCDVLIENFRPGTLEKWGLGYEELSKINAGLIMVRISGYGQSGPYSERPGYGVVCEAVGGLRYINGDPDHPPARSNIGLTDCITGLYSAFATVMALRYRERTGVGQVVDSALYECAFSFMEPHIPAYDKLGFVVEREGSAHAGSVVNNLYETRDGDYVHIQGSQTNSFRRLCLAIGRPDMLEDARYNTRLERVKHGDEVDAIVGEWVGARDYSAVEQALGAGDVVFTRIYSMADIFKDPHYRARGMLAEVPDEDLGTVTVAAPVPRLTKTPGRISRTGGGIGRDTRSVLSGVLGLSDAELGKLEADQVIACAGTKKGTI
jgi:crotonobetainyl-CoA:carnitine CoA-transferase CaiB-like acyl-CoA transferase